jgi:SAM-dependent methyltransferase
MTAIKEYGAARASAYEDESTYAKGDREGDWCVARDLLEYRTPVFSRFLELGCGTGFFSKRILDTFPACSGVLIDGSTQMLEKARLALVEASDRAQLRESRFEDLPWQEFEGQFDVVFSSFALHHLTDADKWEAFDGIFGALRARGRFVYVDHVRGDDDEESALLEYLACKDIQRRLKAKLRVEKDVFGLGFERILAKDRAMRMAEGDQEAAASEIRSKLKSTGFTLVAPVRQHARIATFYCEKR